ncbi:MAG TPA: VOC family protein [Streptosporangiaceae bacterium]
MLTQIDHIIVAVSGAEHRALSARLAQAGFLHGDAGRHPGGTANENVAFAGGGFLELLYEQEPGSGPPVWFADTPRVQGIGFSTSDYDADIAAWGTPEGSWNRIFPKVLDTGEPSQCRAAGPLPMHEFYVFYMDRPAPSFADLAATPRLTGVTFRGAGHQLWRDRFASWFRLPAADGGLRGGDVTFRFEPGDHSAVRLSLAFAVRRGEGSIPISGGTIELVRDAR